MGKEFRGQHDKGAWLDPDELVTCEVAKGSVGGHPGSADGLTEALLPLGQRDPSPMCGGGLNEPRRGPGGGVVKGSADAFGLVVAYLCGEVGKDVTAYGGNVVDERQDLVAGDSPESGGAACLPGGGVATAVEDGGLVHRAGCVEVAEVDAAALGAVMEGGQRARFDDQQVGRRFAAGGDHSPAGNGTNS
ncbi:hypothetical protein ABN028_21895 [Actinopolymorpha sp. B17G11]|uniref:hypothetical protein n=1 Tax=Actinopolymorpha sp. B17G11 TaxID=3160861 RepID=UPI0032E489B5